MCFATPKIPPPPPPPPPPPGAPQASAMAISTQPKANEGKGFESLRIPVKQMSNLNMGGAMSPINV